MPTTRLIIFDDFHPDPDAVRAMALGLDYPVRGPFPGRGTLNVDPERWLGILADLLNLNIGRPGPRADVAQFRLTPAGATSNSDIHFDRTDWAGVCYLTPRGGSGGGTAFFRHRETGMERFPTLKERRALIEGGIVHAAGPEDPMPFIRYFGEEGRDRSKWERVMAIPHRYNRAAFYDAQQFHSIDSLEGFGGAVGARLTQVFFFNLAKG